MSSSILRLVSTCGFFFISALSAQQADVGFNGPIPNTVLFGGSDADYAEAAFVDSAGYISVIGSAKSPEFFGLPKGTQPQNSNFLARFRPDGTRISVNVLTLGWPYTADQLGNLYGFDTGLTKLTPDGSATLYRLPLAGYPKALAVDGTGRAYVALEVGDNGLTATTLVAQISAAGDRIERQFSLPWYSPVTSLALDPSGAVYLAGNASANFIATPGVLRQTCDSQCGFVVKISAALDRLEYATLVGGSGMQIDAVVADGAGNAYLAGQYTYSGGNDSDIPPSAYMGSRWTASGASFMAGFVARLNPTAQRLDYAWAIGMGTPRALSLAPDGSAVVAVEMLYTGYHSLGLWKVGPQLSTPQVLARCPVTPWQSPYPYDSKPQISVDATGNVFAAWGVPGGFPRTDLGLPSDAILLKAAANSARADLSVTINAPPLAPGDFSPVYSATVTVKNNGPESVGPVWLTGSASGWFTATDAVLVGKGAQDGNGFRIAKLDPGQEVRVVVDYNGSLDATKGAPGVWGEVLSLTADPNAVDNFLVVTPPQGTETNLLTVTTQPDARVLYHRSDITNLIDPRLGSLQFGDTVSVWFPPVQQSFGTLWQFTGWSDGSTDPVRTITATGANIRLTATIAPVHWIEAYPPALYFVSIAGSVPRPKIIWFYAPAIGDFVLSTPSDPRVTVTPTRGTSEVAFQVSVNTAGLAPGEYDFSLPVTQDGQGPSAARTIPVIVRVLAQAPQLSADHILDAASYRPAPFFPSQIVAIFAPGIGPKTPVERDLIPNYGEDSPLGGFDVCVGGVPGGAPAWTLYAGGDQLNLALGRSDSIDLIRCPLHDPGSTPVLELVVDGQAVASIPVSLADAGASVFTLDMSGSGNAVAINEDGSVNWLGNPAQAGSLVHLYVEASSAYISDLPMVVEIGGKPADILRISAPDQFLPGFRQVDVFIPDDVEGGPAVPLSVKLVHVSTMGMTTVTEYPSQPNVTLAIESASHSASQAIAPEPGRREHNAGSASENPRQTRPQRALRE